MNDSDEARAKTPEKRGDQGKSMSVWYQQRKKLKGDGEIFMRVVTSSLELF